MNGGQFRQQKEDEGKIRFLGGLSLQLGFATGSAFRRCHVWKAFQLWQANLYLAVFREMQEMDGHFAILCHEEIGGTAPAGRLESDKKCRPNPGKGVETLAGWVSGTHRERATMDHLIH